MIERVGDETGMIRVERLSREYGSVKAVDRLDFEIGRGEIVGFLGPNGAGKTTTMRMLTTYLPPSSGRANLAGHDVLDEPLEVRRKVGYLPENVPLYPEMRVREFLDFRAKLKDVPRSRRQAAVDGVIEQCKLKEVEERIVGNLSKGFRQRVGLAEAMVHDPDILILDEPTAGLDPIQVREVRSLIKMLGSKHTVLLSTHIMPEVEAVCGRVIVIVHGRIALDEDLQKLKLENSIEIEIRGSAEGARKSLASAQGVTKVQELRRDGDSTTFEVQTRDGADMREFLAKRVQESGFGLRRLDRRRSTLEDRFVEAVRVATLSQAKEAAEGDAKRR